MKMRFYELQDDNKEARKFKIQNRRTIRELERYQGGTPLLKPYIHS